ncbi:MAG: Bifunctional homocysteine S-methyltransferase/5,10-methylenetetrahydrofolate reductase [Planctomycetes bacterium]|nr:Bifunctional homocysteine S-methyltransferase/5,10-methylenetetrahydrofolate reductase [Planctomycetota bacterium]
MHAAPREPAAAQPPKDEGSFLRRLGKEPLVVAELDPPKSLRTEKLLEGAKRLRDAGAHLVSMAENPLASIRMGNVGAAYLVRRDAGAEPLVHFTCRDRNAIGLHSDLMGASALGIRHVLAITGDPAGAPGGGVTSVYDVNSVGLVRIIASLNAGRTMHGAELGRGAGFTVGVAFNPNFRTMTGQVRKLRDKAEAGARFALSQLVYDADRIRRIREAVAPCGIPVLPGVMPLVSHRNAMFMHQEVPGVRLPDEVLARMERRGSGPDAEREGMDLARELIDAAMESGAPGIYVVTPFQRADLSAELVKYVRSKRLSAP